MTTAAAGPISQAEELLRNMLGDSGAFRTWTGTATREPAQGKVFLHELPAPAGETYSTDELGWMFPCAVVTTAAEEGFTWHPVAMDVAMGSGLIRCDFYDAIEQAPAISYAEAARRFLNRVGLVALDLRSLSAQMHSDYLLLGRFAMTGWGEGEFAGHTEIGPFLCAKLLIPWGREG